MEVIDLWKFIGPALALGGAWGGAKVALNGTRDRVARIDAELRDHISEENQHDLILHERIAQMETKIDVLLDRTK